MDLELVGSAFKHFMSHSSRCVLESGRLPIGHHVTWLNSDTVHFGVGSLLARAVVCIDQLVVQALAHIAVPLFVRRVRWRTGKLRRPARHPRLKLFSRRPGRHRRDH